MAASTPRAIPARAPYVKIGVHTWSKISYPSWPVIRGTSTRFTEPRTQNETTKSSAAIAAASRAARCCGTTEPGSIAGSAS